MMDTRVLRYFLAVAREENITKAANFLNIAQPSLSVQIMQLEQELGKKLLIRGKRRITLTEEGILLRKRAEEIISLLDKTEKEITCDEKEVGGEISIGSGETEAMNVAVQVATSLAEKYPNIHYYLFSGDAEAIMEQLDNGLLDFGILIEPVDIKKYERIQLNIKDVWGILMKADSPLATKSVIEAKDIEDISIISPKRTELQKEFASWIRRDFQNLNIVATYNLIYNASLLVKEGFGYAIVLDKLVYTGEGSDLCFRPFAPKMEIKLSIVWKKYKILSKAAEKFIEELNNSISKTYKSI